MIDKQISFDEVLVPDWQLQVNNLLKELVIKHELTENAFVLSPNYGRKTEKKDNSQVIISYSICIEEEAYPKGSYNLSGQDKASTVIMRIQPSKKDSSSKRVDVYVPDTTFAEVGLAPETVKRNDDVSGWKKYAYEGASIDSILELLLNHIEIICEYALRKYKSKAAAFGACSRYIQCAEAGHCLHPNKLYARACVYYSNLISGNNFYNITNN